MTKRIIAEREDFPRAKLNESDLFARSRPTSAKTKLSSLTPEQRTAIRESGLRFLRRHVSERFSAGVVKDAATGQLRPMTSLEQDRCFQTLKDLEKGQIGLGARGSIQLLSNKGTLGGI